MFTPQEIQERADSLEKAVFGGYSVSAVDELLTPLSEDYAAIYKENAVLKSKMKVLVEKIAEYRSQEDSIKKALLKAQQTSEEILSNAERRSAQMLTESEQRLRTRNQELSKEVLAEQERVNQAKRSAARFIAELEQKIQDQLAGLEQIKQMDLTTGENGAPGSNTQVLRRGRVQEQTPPPTAEDKAREIGNNLTRILEESADTGESLEHTRVMEPIGDKG